MDTRLLAAAVFLLLSPLPAYAYIDPGSGMLIWQGLLAVVGGVIVFAKNPIRMIKGLLERLKRR